MATPSTNSPSRLLLPLTCVALFGSGCGDSGRGDGASVGDGTGSSTSVDSSSDGESSESETDTAAATDTDTDTSEETETETETGTDTTDTDTGDEGCQVAPERCPDASVCDFITGECAPPDLACVLAGDYAPCGASSCGPGTVCDDQGACIPRSPCGVVTCEGSQCWGSACACERVSTCQTATAEQLNGPFSEKMFDLEFADDCTAWMVTLRSGTDYLRRLTPSGTVTQWDGVSNLDMGEVAVLRAIIPQAPPAPPVVEIDAGQGPLQPDGGGILGEVALTYICTGGCFGADPQGVARLIEGAMVPLPLVITAVPTVGQSGPFGAPVADGGPMGLTWGENLQLYVGNANQNGDYDTANLDEASTQLLTTFATRVTASAPVSAVHLLLALDNGDLLRFNTVTLESTLVANLGVDVTSLSHDAFSGEVYASLADLSVVTVDPFDAEQAAFVVMPALGRVALSPDGKLWYAPAKYLVGEDVPLTSWDLPTTW